MNHGKWLMRGVLAVVGPLLFASSAAAQTGSIVLRDTVEISVEFRARIAPAFAARGADVDDFVRGVVLQRIVYLSDGLRVHGYLAEPRDGIELPVVIQNRGGNRELAALTDTSAAISLGTLAQNGYIVVASQYRGNAGGEGREEFGGADVNDVLNLIALIDQHPRADATRIGMEGWSRGGMMTYLALTRTDRVRGAVIGAGLADVARNIQMRPEMEENVFSELVPNWATERQLALNARSAVRWPEDLHKGTPILLLHGSADWRVHPTEALDMARALYEAQHPFRLIFFEGADHGISEYRAEVTLATLEWLNRYVRDKGPLPNLEPHGP
jgi:dipeptidyl aminopeptidase/acylaminoacyl peptidase